MVDRQTQAPNTGFHILRLAIASVVPDELRELVAVDAGGSGGLNNTPRRTRRAFAAPKTLERRPLAARSQSSARTSIAETPTLWGAKSENVVRNHLKVSRIGHSAARRLTIKGSPAPTNVISKIAERPRRGIGCRLPEFTGATSSATTST